MGPAARRGGVCGISVCSLRVSESVYIESVVSERKHNQVGGGRMGCGGGKHRHRVRRPDLAPSTPPHLPCAPPRYTALSFVAGFFAGRGGRGLAHTGRSLSQHSAARGQERRSGRRAGKPAAITLATTPQSLRSIDKETSLWNDTSRCSLVRCSSTDYTRLYFYDDSL